MSFSIENWQKKPTWNQSCILLQSQISKFKWEIAVVTFTLFLFFAYYVLFLNVLFVYYPEMRWEEWSTWGQCAAHCKNGVGDRLQSRTRNRKKADNSADESTQTESRPCNTVQFAGCISPQNGDQFFAVAYDFEHMLAQSTCTAMSPAGRINAVRRTCSDNGPDCNAVCQKVGTTCFNALHVYSDPNYVTPLERPAVEQKSLEIYKYNGCSGQFCGPNFCCCKS